MVKEVEFIVSGDVQGVGYGQYVAKVGRKLKLVGFVGNLASGTVTQTIFEEKYGDANAEMAQGFSTGMNYMNHTRIAKLCSSQRLSSADGGGDFTYVHFLSATYTRP